MQILTSLDGLSHDELHHWFDLHPLSPKSSNPSARVGHSLIYSLNEKCLYCIGGADPDGLSESLHKFYLNSMMWKEMPVAGFNFRYEHSAFGSRDGDKILPFVFGGADKSGNRNDLQMWDSDDQQWKNILPEGMPPSPRTQHSCAVSNGLLYVFGGGDIGAEPVADRSVFVFDPEKNSWTRMETTGSSPCSRQGHCMISIENQIYVHGGMNGEDFYDDLYVLDTKEKNWVLINPVGCKPQSRAAHGAVAVAKDIYIFGGLGREGSLNDFFSFSTEHSFWLKIEIGAYDLPLPRLDFAMCCVEFNDPSSNLDAISNSATDEDEISSSHGNTNQLEKRTLIFLHGGMDTSGKIFDDFYVYLV